jgi:hypothetical protein
MLGVAEHVLISGLDDLASAELPLIHPRLVPLRIEQRIGTGVEAFWFVVVNHPYLYTALLARHVSGDLWSRSQSLRRYTGLWTFDPAVVEHVIAILRHGACLLK